MSTAQAAPAGVTVKLGAEIAFFVLLVALGVLCIDTSTPDSISFMVTEYLDAAAYSQFVGTILVITGLYHIYVALKKRNTNIHIPHSTSFGFIITVMYVLGFMRIGFYVSTFIYLALYSFIIEDAGERNLKTKILFSAVSIAVFYGTFSWFKIYLPPAWLM